MEIDRAAGRALLERAESCSPMLVVNQMRTPEHQRVGAETPLDAISGGGRPPARSDCHARALAAVPAERRVHPTADAHAPADDGQIGALHAATFERVHQVLVGGEGARDHQQATGVLVEPVHDARPRHAGERRIQVQQRIHQRAVGVARAGMNHQPGGLVHHQQMRILVDDRDVQCLGLPALGVARLGDLELHALAAGDPVPRPAGTAIHLRKATANPFRKPRAGVFRKHGRQRLIEPRTGKLVGYDGGANLLLVHVRNLLP